MTATPPPSTQNTDDLTVVRTAVVDAFLSNLTDAQAGFVRSVADATTWLGEESAGLAQCAALHARLTQQMFDAQRAILRRRADTDAAARQCDESAEIEAAAIVDAALAEAAELCSDLDEVTAFGDVLAMRRDGRDPSSPELIESVATDGDRRVEASEQHLQTLLDEWWRLEVERGKDTLDDATARAAVCLHLADIEAGEIREAARVVNATRALEDEAETPADVGAELEQIDVASPVTPIDDPAPSQLPLGSSPIVYELDAALDTADSAGLDALLASFLDALRDPPADVMTSDADVDTNEASNASSSTVPPRATSSASPAGPQDAFDHFWGSGHGRVVHRSVRDWLFVQILLPMVAVVAVLALVLAWIG